MSKPTKLQKILALKEGDIITAKLKIGAAPYPITKKVRVLRVWEHLQVVQGVFAEYRTALNTYTTNVLFDEIIL